MSAHASTAAPGAPRRRVNGRILALGLLVASPLLLVLVLNLGRDPHAVASPLVGRAAPDFALRRVGGGEPVVLSALRGRPVVVNFWATWCVPCYEEHPVLTQAARSLQGSVQFLGVVHEDDEEQVRLFLARNGASYPSLLDPTGTAAIAYGIFGVPETFFIDGQGRIAAKFVGPLDPDSLAENLRKAGLAR